MIALADLVEVDPLGPRPSEAGEVEVGAVGSADLDPATGALREVARVAPRTIPAMARAVRKNDVLFSSSPESVGAVAVAHELPNGITFALPELVVLRPKDDVEPSWIRAFLMRPAVLRALAAQLTATTDPRLVATAFLPRLRLSERSVEERDSALAAIQEIDTCTKLRERTLPRLNQVPGLLVRNDEATPLVALQDVVQVLGSGTPGPAAVDKPVFFPADVIDGRVAGRGRIAFGTELALPLQNGDLVLVADDGSGGRVGDAAVYDGEPAGASAGTGLHRVRPARGMDSHYLWAWLRSPDGRATVSRVVRRSGSGTRLALPVSDLGAVRVPCPAVGRQRQIGTDARECRLLADYAHQQYRRLQALREAYENEVFGTLEVGPALTTRPAAHSLAALKAALSASQRDVWDRIITQPQPLSALAEPGQAEHVRRTLELLERVGVVVRDTTGAEEGWRYPLGDIELLESV